MPVALIRSQNVLAHWYFTTLLLPALRAGVESGGARVVTVASSGADFISEVDWDTFRESPARKKKGPIMLYSQSKFLNVVTTVEFARRYENTGIIFSSLNPGALEFDRCCCILF